MGERNRSEKLSGIVPKIYGILTCVTVLFLIWMTFFQNVEVYRSRKQSGYEKVSDYQVREIKDEEAPAGIRKEYRWTLGNLDENDDCIAFYTVHQYATVYVEEELVYSLSLQENNIIGNTTANNWAIIPLYVTDSGKEVRVEITPIYKSIVKRKTSFFVGSEYQMYVDRLKADLLTIVLCALAIAVGIVLIVLGCIHYHRKGSQTNQMYLGIFAVIIGMWKITDTRFSPFLFPKNTLVLSYITLLMLMLAPVAIILFIEREFKLKHNKILNAIGGISVVGGSIVLILQILNIADLRETLYIVHVYLALSALSVVFVVICEWKKLRNNLRAKVALLCLTICAVGALGDLVAFYMKGNSSGILYTLSALIIYAVTTGILSNQELGQRANLDLHTGLYNKSRCREFFEDEGAVKEKCAVIMYDLNHLKSVNDTMGHEEGDRLIRGFAEVLKNNFPQKAFVARYGGDEFVAVVKIKDKHSAEHILKGIGEEVALYNERTDGASISYAVGYVISTDYPGERLSDLLERADQKMYQDKKQYHQNEE